MAPIGESLKQVLQQCDHNSISMSFVPASNNRDASFYEGVVGWVWMQDEYDPRPTAYTSNTSIPPIPPIRISVMSLVHELNQIFEKSVKDM
jgi:hypothetical protein